MEKIFEQIRQERIKQSEKWGQQNHPSSYNYGETFDYPTLIAKYNKEVLGIIDEKSIKMLVDGEHRTGTSNWTSIALEEFVEVANAANDYERRNELVQLAAVVVQWIECLDRNNRCIVPKIQKFDDNSIMPFGKYKGVAMANVPASYLLWLYDQDCRTQSTQVYEYIKEHYDILSAE